MKVSVLVLCAVVSAGTIGPRDARAQTPPAPVPGPSPQLEGRITVARTTIGGTSGSSADAVFARSSLWGTPIASDGPCTVYTHPVNEGLSAGTITVTGTAQTITLDESHADGGVRYRHSAPVPDPSFVDGAAIKVDASGGADVPAFTASVNAPPELAGYTPPTSLSRTGYTATWTAHSGTEITIAVGALSPGMKNGVLVMCRVPDTGSFTVPASTFALIPPAFDHAIVVVARVAETVHAAGDVHIAIDAISSIGSGPFLLGPSAVDRNAVVRALAAAAPPAPHGETSPRLYVSVGLGFGGVSRNGYVPPTHGPSWRAQFGQRLVHGLHLVEEMTSLAEGTISTTAAVTTEKHLSMGAGVRWTPFEPRPQRASGVFPFIFPGPFVDLRSFYVTAVVGADLRDRFMDTPAMESSEDTAWSPMGSLAVGLLEVQGHDWSFGPELREQLAHHDGHLQRGWMVMFAIHLNEW